LLSRFYDPQHGRITIDGHDVTTLDTEWLRSQVGMVSQDITLFHGTIYDNIAYGCPNKTKEEVEEAARMANAHGMFVSIVRLYSHSLFYHTDFIMSFADGYSTLVGNRGRTLSGGQIQRIAIARAILKVHKSKIWYNHSFHYTKLGPKDISFG
jgi:ABC-type multidrug transport system fused ATPase/permease subunit